MSPLARSLLGLTTLCAAGCADNLAPVFEPPIADRVVSVGESVTLAVRAVDRDGDRLKYGARGLPVGSTFDRAASPPIFRWSPVASDAEGGGRAHPITFIAQDEHGAETEARVVVTVYLGDTAPRFTSPSSYVIDREPWTLDVWVEVRDDDSRAVTFTLVEAPEGARLAPEAKRARLTWTATEDQRARRFVFGFTVQAQDENPDTATQQHIAVVIPPPAAEAGPPEGG